MKVLFLMLLTTFSAQAYSPETPEVLEFLNPLSSPAELAKIIIKTNIEPDFDQFYQDVQMQCFELDEPSECEKYRDFLGRIVTELVSQQGLNNDDPVESLLGIELDGADITRNEIEAADPNWDYVEGVDDSDRYALSAGVPNQDEIEVDLDQLRDTLCRYKLGKEVLVEGSLNELVIKTLEYSFLHNKTPENYKIEIFCLLQSYYFLTSRFDDYERILIYSLDLNVPCA